MRTIKENFMVVVMVVCMLGMFLAAGMSIRSLKKETYGLKLELEEAQKEISVLKKQQEDSEDAFKLMCGTKAYNAGAVNGITKAELGAFKIESPYPTVIYQVLNADGTVLSQAQKQGNAKINTITLEKMPEDMKEVRILGFDETGNQCCYKIYNFGLTE